MRLSSLEGDLLLNLGSAALRAMKVPSKNRKALRNSKKHGSPFIVKPKALLAKLFMVFEMESEFSTGKPPSPAKGEGVGIELA